MAISLATNTQSYDAAGRPWPLGATVSQEGVNFSVFSSNATHVQLLLFDAEDSPLASRIIDLDRRTNHTSYYWHAYVPDICAGQLYAYRMDGPRAPKQGHRFDFEKLLLDPYGKAISSRLYRRSAAVSSAYAHVRFAILTLTLLAVGDPLLLMGDEVRRTQQGNNNAYCQNNEISCFDWDLCRTHADLHRFVQLLIRLRLHFARAAAMDLSLSELLERARIEWHGVRLGQPDLSVDSHSLATMAQFETGDALYVMLSAYWEPLTFSVPSPPAGIDPWYRVIDSSCKPPEDFVEEWTKPVNANTYVVQPRSVALLIASSRSEKSDTVMPPYPLEQPSLFP